MKGTPSTRDVSSRHTSLYRLYNNAGDLLYIGIAGNPGRRFHQHAKDKAWWGDVANITLEHYRTRIAAEQAEQEAIKAERPRYNVVHNNTRPADPTMHDGTVVVDHTTYVTATRARYGALHQAIYDFAQALIHDLGQDELTTYDLLEVVGDMIRLDEYPDQCDRCERGSDDRYMHWQRPFRVYQTGNGIRAMYVCLNCGHSWYCSWGWNTWNRAA